MNQQTGSDRWVPLARQTALITGTVGTVILLAAAALAWSWRAELPPRVASHWGFDGVQTSTASLGSFTGLMIGMGLGCAWLFAIMCRGLGYEPSNRKWLGALTVWIAAFHALLTLSILEVQRGLVEATNVHLPGWVWAASIGIPTVLAACTWALMARDQV